MHPPRTNSHDELCQGRQLSTGAGWREGQQGHGSGIALPFASAAAHIVKPGTCRSAMAHLRALDSCKKVKKCRLDACAGPLPNNSVTVVEPVIMPLPWWLQ